MNNRKSREQALKEYHLLLERNDPIYKCAIQNDPLIKNYNKSKLKRILKRKRKTIDFKTKKLVIEERFVSMGSL
jgi:hypothetical protein